MFSFAEKGGKKTELPPLKIYPFTFNLFEAW